MSNVPHSPAPASALVNGALVPLPADDTRLLDWLRMSLGLTGPKEGCGQGHCGACTVLIDGRPALSCCIFASLTAGTKIMTSEGLASTPLGERLSAAFIDHGAVQCGYCTPGMFVAAYALVAGGDPDPPPEEVRRALLGNICRCTGYAQIVEAVMSVRQAWPPPDPGAS